MAAISITLTVGEFGCPVSPQLSEASVISNLIRPEELLKAALCNSTLKPFKVAFEETSNPFSGDASIAITRASGLTLAARQE